MGPRVESAIHIMAMGLGGSLDEAFRDQPSNEPSAQTQKKLTGAIATPNPSATFSPSFHFPAKPVIDLL
jgi:hypothetical protein